MTTPDPLDDLLSEWQVSPTPPNSLNRDIWTRIALVEAEPTWWETLAALILRPRNLAFSSLAAFGLGIGFAFLREAPDSAMDPHTAYVQSISPFASQHLASH